MYLHKKKTPSTKVFPPLIFLSTHPKVLICCLINSELHLGQLLTRCILGAGANASDGIPQKFLELTSQKKATTDADTGL